ncbi:MAG: Fe2+-dependent dioxygenase [Microgenomates group bacterium]
MMLVIPAVLTEAQVLVLQKAGEGLRFDDGKKTAGRFVRDIKANDQAAASPERDALLTMVEQAVRNNPVFRAAARPKALTPLMLSRYRAGQTYGLHVDDAMMQGLRSDLSFTLFLADPTTYDGGALIIEDSLESREIKLAAGDMILYPTTTLHRVEPVTRGTRLAVVGWVQSLLRDSAQREILFDLDQACEAVFAQQGKSPLLDKLSKTRSNLLRMWIET